MKRLTSVLSALLMLILAVLPVMANSWQFTSEALTVDANRTITGDLFFNGDKVEIDGTVTGDLIVLAREVIVNGHINGSILGIATGRVTINGVVDGNIRVAAGIMALNGQVGHNISAYAMHFIAGRHSKVSGGILGTYSNLKLTGTVVGPVDVTTYMSNSLGGTVGGNVTAKGAQLRWLAPVQIGGRVDDYSGTAPKKVAVPKVVIAKGYHAHPAPTEPTPDFKMLVIISLVWFLGSVLMSLIFYRIFPRTAWRITEPNPTMLKRSFLIGLITLFAVPIVIFLLVISMVGLPIALILLLLYVALLIFANIPVALLLGRLFLRHYGPAYPARPVFLIILGSLFTSVITALPLIGFIIPTSLGIGMLVQNIRPEYQELQF